MFNVFCVLWQQGVCLFARFLDLGGQGLCVSRLAAASSQCIVCWESDPMNHGTESVGVAGMFSAHRMGWEVPWAVIYQIVLMATIASF